MEYTFLFDLDATITSQEILPELARKVGRFQEMCALTERTMQGEIPFETSFLQRVEILKSIPVHDVRHVIEEIRLNQQVLQFLKEKREQCYIVTGNLDVWIEGLLEKIGMRGRCLCSQGTVQGDILLGVKTVIHKKAAIQALPRPLVAVGDGDNDAEMIADAEIGIGFGGVRPVAPSVLESADYVIYSEERLCQFLKQL